MAVRSPRLLLEGRPGVGKTTVVRGLVERLTEIGVPVFGFTTRELREHGRRVGFVAEGIEGGAAVIAHVDFVSGPRVGRYRVDVAAFESVALPALERAKRPGVVVVVDELGRMELASPGFVAAVEGLFSRGGPVVATVQVVSHPVTDALKRRPGVERVEVSERNRDTLPGRLSALLVQQGGNHACLP